MPVTLERKPLVEALRLLRQVVQARDTIPILGNLLLDADDGMLRMTATDLDRWLTVAVEATDIGAPMRLTVPAARLSAFVGALAVGSEICLAERPKTQRLEISAGRARHQVATLPADDWPAPKADDIEPVEIDAALLRRLLHLPSAAVSDEETRFYLCGVHLVAAGDGAGGRRLSSVATNGHMLLHLPVALPEELAGIPALEAGIIVPAGTVQTMCAMLAGEQTARLGIGGGLITLACGETRLVSRLIDGTFPDFHRVIPARGAEAAPRAARADLLEAAKRCGIAGSAVSGTGRGRAIHVAQDGAELVLSSRDDTGAAEERLPLAGNLAESFGVQPAYLDQILHLATGEQVGIEMTNAAAPIRLIDDGDPTVDRIVMPVRTSPAPMEG